MNDKQVEKVKRLVAFCILMQHGEGIMTKTPDYLLQKHHLAMTLPVDLLHQLFFDQGRMLEQYYKEMSAHLTNRQLITGVET
jgi:hypothetical protein